MEENFSRVFWLKLGSGFDNHKSLKKVVVGGVNKARKPGPKKTETRPTIVLTILMYTEEL